jgi:microsomal dipeptidase-like Zn-dependent dipeptidase
VTAHDNFQNAQAFEDHLGHIEAFADMGVRVVQLCYNTQNLIGCIGAKLLHLIG